jgi:hypothetical protein
MKLKIEAVNICRFANRCGDDECKHRTKHYHSNSCNVNCLRDKTEDTSDSCENVEAERHLTFIERYKEHNNDGAIFGTLWMLYYTCIEFYQQLSLAVAGRILRFLGIGFAGPINMIYDGYWLVFLSPFVLVYWIILSIISFVLLLFPIAVPLLLFIPVAYLLFIPVGVWSLLFELPASLMNKKEKDIWK